MYNHSNIWKNTTMIIFFILLVSLIFILLINIKLNIFFEIEGTTSNFKIKFLFFEFKRKGKFVLKAKKCKRKENQNKHKNILKKFIDKKCIMNILSKIKFEKLHIYEEIGLLEPFYTAIATSIISTLTIIPVRILNVKFDNFYYKAVPFYTDLKFKLKIESIISFKIINILFCIFKSILHKLYIKDFKEVKVK